MDNQFYEMKGRLLRFANNAPSPEISGDDRNDNKMEKECLYYLHKI